MSDRQYFHTHYICEKKLLCPRVERLVSEQDCRCKCRYYYGRGIIKFAKNFDPLNPKVPGEPEEKTNSKWHICNFPDTSDHLREISEEERQRIMQHGRQ